MSDEKKGTKKRKATDQEPEDAPKPKHALVKPKEAEEHALPKPPVSEAKTKACGKISIPDFAKLKFGGKIGGKISALDDAERKIVTVALPLADYWGYPRRDKFENAFHPGEKYGDVYAISMTTDPLFRGLTQGQLFEGDIRGKFDYPAPGQWSQEQWDMLKQFLQEFLSAKPDTLRLMCTLAEYDLNVPRADKKPYSWLFGVFVVTAKAVMLSAQGEFDQARTVIDGMYAKLKQAR